MPDALECQRVLKVTFGSLGVAGGESWRPASCFEAKMDMYYERLPLEEYEHHPGCRGMRYTRQALHPHTTPNATSNNIQAAQGPYTLTVDLGHEEVLPQPYM